MNKKGFEAEPRSYLGASVCLTSLTMTAAPCHLQSLSHSVLPTTQRAWLMGIISPIPWMRKPSLTEVMGFIIPPRKKNRRCEWGGRAGIQAS